MSKVTGKALDWKLLGRVMHYVKPYKSMFIIAALLTILLSVVSLAQPYLMEKAVDDYILKGDYPGLVRIVLLMIAILLLQTAVQYFQTFLTNSLGQSVIKDLRIHVFNHISSLKLSYFDKTPIGMLITRTVSDLETIADIFSEGLISIVGDMLLVIGIMALMLSEDWRLTLVTLIPMPLL